MSNIKEISIRFDEDDMIDDQGRPMSDLNKKNNIRKQMEYETTKRYAENQKITSICQKMDEKFNSYLKKLMAHMSQSHANYEQNLMNLYQKLDYDGYYSRVWDDGNNYNNMY